MTKDISTLLQEIKAATKWSEPRLATEIGTSQPTINRIMNGQRDCKVSTWQAIVALNAKICGDSSSSSECPQNGECNA